MEIEELILGQAFDRVATALPSTTLAGVLTNITNFSIEELIFNPNNESTITTTINHLHQIARQAVALRQIDELAAMIQVADAQLGLFFKEKDVASLMRFIHINLPLHIPYQNYSAVQYLTDQAASCVAAISEILRKVNINVNVPASASFHEKELEANARLGYTERSIDKVYDFALSIERGGRGFHLNGFLEKLIVFQSELDLASYLSILDSRTKIEEYIMYLQGLSKLVLLKCSVLIGAMTNSWAVFELLRQLLKKENKNQNIQLDEHNAVCLCLKFLYRESPDFYFQTITFFHDASLLNSALGEQLAELTEHDTERLINQALPLKTTVQLIDYRTLLLEKADLHLSRSQYHNLLHHTFHRWKKEYDQQFKDPDAFWNQLFLTSHANFVIHYYNELVDPIIVEAEIKQILHRLLWIDCEWFENASQQVTAYYLYLSKLYLISYSCKNKSITDREITELIQSLTRFEPASDYINNDKYPGLVAEIASNILQKVT